MKEKQPPVEIGQIKRALKTNQDLADYHKGMERDLWDVYDDPLSKFGMTFGETIPIDKGFQIKTEPRSFSFEDICEAHFKQYIEETLSQEKNRVLTAIELGGPGSNLFHGFTPHFFQKTIGVCLKDIRSKIQKQEDESINHSVMEGDILDVQSEQVLNKIKEKLGGDKTDLIISRMVGALKSVDMNSAILDRVVRNWYNLLNENGLMFIQFRFKVPEITGEFSIGIKNWATAIQKLFPIIDIEVGKRSLRLHKKAGSPEELPNAYQLFKPKP